MEGRSAWAAFCAAAAAACQAVPQTDDNARAQPAATAVAAAPVEGPQSQYLHRLPALVRRLGRVLQDSLYSEPAAESPLVEGAANPDLQTLKLPDLCAAAAGAGQAAGRVLQDSLYDEPAAESPLNEGERLPSTCRLLDRFISYMCAPSRHAVAAWAGCCRSLLTASPLLSPRPSKVWQANQCQR